ncbi:VOC family protein [Paenibacillus qinlingensis]|uniref:Lactoylglutathione lyase n=1 Tax=Paenibacillus qinlingensis TaxID=1837343 RepID=A0ABU1NWE8_9BACL|nr:VOC family protein [Paenibacillus qinlingensis]MDR6551803.1 putative lactoylglutathione lyase [Paenibacillus qinlingensis]
MSQSPFFGVGIFVPVSDLKRSTEWYTRMLGFEIRHKDEPNATVTMMNDNKIIFCLVRSYNIEQKPFPKNDYGVGQYFNFHAYDVESAYNLLRQRGADVGEIEEFDGMRGFSIQDPDGNRYGVVN